MVRMVDVAKEAGVSLKTVSRVLNNEPRVQEAMRQRVREAMDRLGYVPSATARSLRSRRSFQIMLLVHDVRSSFVSTVQFGALQACQDLGYNLRLAMAPTDRLVSEEALTGWMNKAMQSGKPDGIVLVPPLANDTVVETVVEKFGIKTVRIGVTGVEDTEDRATVTIDDRQAARDITHHLLELGHKRIAFLRGREDQDATETRYRGYCDALGEAGLDVDGDLVLPGLFDFDSGIKQGLWLLDLPEPPTAVFAANDDMAAGVVTAAYRRGISIPRELSVVGFDDSEIAVRTLPALTTVVQPLEAMGKAAVETVIEAAGTSKLALQSKLLDYHLRIRESTAEPLSS